MIAQQVLVSRLSGDRAAALAGARQGPGERVGDAQTTTAPSAPTDLMFGSSGRRIVSSDVRDLIDAAGPLSLRDIAGGLDVSNYQAAALVHSMIEHNCLRQDEWERFRLPSACRV